MSVPSEMLTPDERGDLARLLGQLGDGETHLKEICAEILLWRRVGIAIRANRYLMNNDTVRKVLDRTPGSRFVPAASLPRYARRP